jgi:5-methylcytosine-specific restriction enzyme A
MTWTDTRTRQERGYGQAWQRLRAEVLKRARYLCQCAECSSTARVRLASEVDHIVPKAKGGTDHLSNLQAIHPECHKRKTQRDEGHTPKERIGLDGYPLRPTGGQGAGGGLLASSREPLESAAQSKKPKQEFAYGEVRRP